MAVPSASMPSGISSPVVVSVRALSPSGDPQRGNGLQNFLVNLDATAQNIRTALLLFQGEWFAALGTGTPMFQSILGVPNTSEGVAMLLRVRIMQVPYVTGVQNFVINYTGNTRACTYSATAQTPFGPVQLTNQTLPGNNASVNMPPNATT